MAQRRMFSKDITGADAFLEMPVSSQLLYFHLGMEADDDGFIGSPKKISRMIGAGDDDIKILLSKRFLITFESGVVVIKHWKINNYIQNDRYKETRYLDEKKAIITKENGAYTECIQKSNKMETQVRLGKVRLGKENMETANAVSADQPKNDFNQKEYISEMRKTTNPPHIRLIGWYFEHRGAQFPDVEAIRMEIARWVKDAKFISKYDNDKIGKTLELVKKKFPDDWKLSTIRKYITE